MKKFTDMEKYATIFTMLNNLDVNDLYKVDDENYISVAELIDYFHDIFHDNIVINCYDICEIIDTIVQNSGISFIAKEE